MYPLAAGIACTVFSRVPDKYRRMVKTAWADANRGGDPVDCFLEGPSFDRVGRPTHHVEPQGECFVTNVAFGGPAGTSLFMTDSGHGQILKAEMPVAGKPMFSHA
jgi:sugar lactone lactonase YvrE